jgi:hypothetical protein
MFSQIKTSKKGLSMRSKDIKREAVRQLKKKFPHWKRLGRNAKKRLAIQVLAAVHAEYDFEAPVDVPVNELLGLAAVPSGVIPLVEMDDFIAEAQGNLFHFSKVQCQRRIQCPELKAIDALLDDEVINRLLASESYTPSMRTLFPSHFLRAELLKSLKYPEFSYRKFCDDIVNNLERSYNLLKHREGLDPLRVRSQQGAQAVATFAQMATLLLEIVGTRRSEPKEETKQQAFEFAS